MDFTTLLSHRDGMLDRGNGVSFSGILRNERLSMVFYGSGVLFGAIEPIFPFINRSLSVFFLLF